MGLGGRGSRGNRPRRRPCWKDRQGRARRVPRDKRRITHAGSRSRARKLIQTPTEEFAKQKQRDESPAERETRWGTQLGPETADPGPTPHWQTK